MLQVAIRCGCFGCDRPVVAHGVCDMHYRRLKRHGHAEQTRPNDWGARSAHPLYQYWKQVRRNGLPLVEGWHTDFWQFVRDVGDRPSNRHMLFRPDKDLPLGPENAIWSTSKAGDALSEEHQSSREKRTAYMQRWRLSHRTADSLHQHRIGLQRAHGITPEDYDRMLDAQGGVCAICGRHEPRRATNAARPFRLAVDHKHGSEEVRGLLCSMCNHAIGYFDDSPTLLRRAIAYLADPPAAKLGIGHSGKHKVRRREREASPYADEAT